MLAIFFTLTLLTTLVRSQINSENVINQAASEGIRVCYFPGSGSTVVVKYNATEYRCLLCGRARTLVTRKESISRKEICQKACNGMLCGNNCLPMRNNEIEPSCLTAKGVIPGGGKAFGGGNGRSTDHKGSQIPLIIGFTVGGILLAIVVAGIFLGRQQKQEYTDGSEQNATTPVSLSNSEWHSNGGSGSTRRREENLRVQEASMEDVTLTGEPMYEFFRDKKEYRKDENANEFLLRAAGDSYSITQDSYNDPFSAEYPQFTPSNRSSEVVLEDGYVPGGNFVGSADPQVQHLLNQNGHSSPSNNITEEQNFFDGKTPGSMTHETICMSLTHTGNNYGDVEYVIEDQDFMEFNEPALFSTTQLAVTNDDFNAEKKTLQIDLECKTDSDFEDHESRPNSAMKSDKSDVFFSDTNSPTGKHERQRSTSDSACATSDSPFSESGIEASYQSKDSCEVIFSQNNAKNLNSSTSWNENCKGHSREDEQQISGKRLQNNFIPNGTNRSKSCTWKSPSAPTHSCSRQQSFPIHCPSSDPAYSRPRHSHVTHVFVDVHRNMASSDEDLLGHAPTERNRNYRKTSATDSESSFSEIPLSAMKFTPTLNSLDKPFSSSTKTAIQGRSQRNKSMYVLRNDGPQSSQNWAPRTVRFSSSGSGEYAIPFGSLVP